MPNKKLYTTLSVRGLELNVNLGWRDKERKQEQPVLLDLIIRFPAAPPAACETDELDDTVCYATLIEHIRHAIAHKKYRLVEHLSADIYRSAKTRLPRPCRLKIRLTKFPKIEGLMGGVTFDYGDEA
ncbi:hypothetical protein AQUSIP_00050 [Aquicella siphonis]|uniref:dihydroneopterin aldolase n=1 Tax=Aquicella siphonis TaxID=254247 RepID=A0A5E4PE85_9COXI|nr:dihydroneopterin aldolase [Aquicella siphonis]VVC74733.1 hypothetical protein AQUSIP_00050 [Aquicella siphonis]